MRSIACIAVVVLAAAYVFDRHPTALRRAAAAAEVLMDKAAELCSDAAKEAASVPGRR